MKILDKRKLLSEINSNNSEANRNRNLSDIEKVEELRMILTSEVRYGKELFDGDSKYSLLVSGANRDIVLNKLIEIIKRF